MPPRRLFAAAAASLLLAAAARADEVRSEKYGRPVLRPSERELAAARPRKWWELVAHAGVASDSNINHLLVNSTLESNLNRPDTIVRSGAGFNLDPALGGLAKTEWSYAYDRFDYSRNTVFSYDAHEIAGDVYPRLSRRWSLDLGGDLDWVEDKNGAIANDQTGRGGVVWSGADRRKFKAGLEYRRDRVTINPLKNGDSRIVYASLSQGVLAKGLAFGSYRYADHATAGPDFSYRAHSLRVGLIGHPAASLKLTGFASYVDKSYDNVDSRFLVRRRDRTFSATLKPTLTAAEGLFVVASFTYARNFSNVGVKEYSDRQLYLGLEGRL